MLTLYAFNFIFVYRRWKLPFLFGSTPWLFIGLPDEDTVARVIFARDNATPRRSEEWAAIKTAERSLRLCPPNLPQFIPAREVSRVPERFGAVSELIESVETSVFPVIEKAMKDTATSRSALWKQIKVAL